MTARRIKRITLARATGLIPPPWAPLQAWPSWVLEGAHREPEVIRFAWCATTGRLWVGVQVDHRLLLARDERHGLGDLVLGYSLPPLRAVAVKGAYDGLNMERPSAVADEAIATFVGLLRPMLSDGTVIYANVNNPFLMCRHARSSSGRVTRATPRVAEVTER